MPSSSAGVTSAEQKLRTVHSAVLAHLYYYLHSCAPSVPYDDLLTAPSLHDREQHIRREIHALFSYLLDDEQVPPAVVTTERYSSGRPSQLDRAYRDLPSAAKTSVDDVASARPTPVAVLESLAAWMESLVYLLEQKGRSREGTWARVLLGEVQRWVEVVVEAMEDLDRAQERMGRGMEHMALRWGV